MPGSRVLLDVLLDDKPTPVGHIVQHAAGHGTPARWAFHLSDGRATGLHSTLSRQDIEGQISELYFQELIADQRHSA
ncbi:MAG: hypothetical protein K9M98_10805 [Cephaloticoccus sp.]|nr:hypothetical protein [Cephaloticoccus sp.]